MLLSLGSDRNVLHVDILFEYSIYSMLDIFLSGEHDAFLIARLSGHSEIASLTASDQRRLDLCLFTILLKHQDSAKILNARHIFS